VENLGWVAYDGRLLTIDRIYLADCAVLVQASIKVIDRWITPRDPALVTIYGPDMTPFHTTSRRPLYAERIDPGDVFQLTVRMRVAA
jgi:hypothetical protein